MSIRNALTLVFAIFCIGLLSGCATSHGGGVRKAEKAIEKKAPDLSEYYDTEQAKQLQQIDEKKTASLWVDSYTSHLYDNMYRASRVGDTVMIVIAEEAQGENKGSTKGDRKTDHKASIDHMGGLMKKLQGIVSIFSPANVLTAKTDSKFQGKASTGRTGSLFAQIAARITKVLKNGNMVIRGEKHITVNKEDQILIVEGIIRPYDIQTDNTVLSSSLADARITYSGFGVVAEKQRPGWLVRVLDHVWPF